MRTIRKIILGVSYFVGAWVLTSFIGVMFNPSNAGIWTSSLMWALLASLIVMPGLVLVYHASYSRSQPTEVSPTTELSPTTEAERVPFIEEEQMDNTLWPTSEEESAQR